MKFAEEKHEKLEAKLDDSFLLKVINIEFDWNVQIPTLKRLFIYFAYVIDARDILFVHYHTKLKVGPPRVTSPSFASRSTIQDRNSDNEENKFV